MLSNKVQLKSYRINHELGMILLIYEEDTFIELRDFNTGSPKGNITFDNSRITTAEFSLDGQYIIICDVNGKIGIWNIKLSTFERILNGHELSVWSAKMNTDNSLIVSNSYDGTARVWNTKTGENIHTFEAYKYGVDWFSKVHFSPDMQYIRASIDGYKTLEWDVRSGKFMHKHPYLVKSIYNDYAYALDWEDQLYIVDPITLKTKTHYQSSISFSDAIHIDENHIFAQGTFYGFVFDTNHEKLSFDNASVLVKGVLEKFLFNDRLKNVNYLNIKDEFACFSFRTNEQMYTLNIVDIDLFGVEYSDDKLRILLIKNNGGLEWISAISGELLQTIFHGYF